MADTIPLHIRSRFTGSTKKGKASKRAAAFNGPGKISVSRSTNPKHGFDHGIRSRVCLEFSDDRVVSVEGNFLDGKLVSGIDFHPIGCVNLRPWAWSLGQVHET